MSPDELKARGRRIAEELFNQGDLAVADELVDPRSAARFKDDVTRVRRALPDLHSHVEEQIVEGDTLVQRLTVTGQRIRASLVEIFRIGPDGRFVRRWTLPDGPGLLRQLGAPQADTRDEPPVWEMVVIHRIFRREFRLLAGLVRRTMSGGAHRDAVAEHVEFTLTGLHNHHGSEDEYLWPLLSERARPHADLVERMEAQHAVVGGHEDRARLLLDKWRRDPTAVVTGELAGTLAQLSDALVEHLDEEEAEVLPLVRKHISVAEWEELGQRAFDKFPRSALPVMLGQMLEEAGPEEAAAFFGKLPAPARLGWRLSGRRQYARYIRRVRGRDKPMNPVLLKAFQAGNRLAVRLYRRSDGRVGGSAKGLPILLITAPGRRTGRPHTVPIVYFEHAGGYLVAGSSGGYSAEPQWVRNVRAAGRARIQVRDTLVDVDARVTAGAERDALWRDVILARAPFFEAYQRKSGRIIPVAVLTPA